MLLVLLVFISGSVSILTTLSPMKTGFSDQPKGRKWSSLYLCLVTKGTNRETVLRSVKEMRHLLQVDHRVRFVVLTEEGRVFDSAQLGVDVVFVPHTYETPLARHKARSLEYFRTSQLLSDKDWVLHLDEETAVDEHCLLACIDFIERTTYEWGQGIILYNTVNYWKNAALTFAEVLRFRDDLGRFQCQHGRIHFTIWGCHGSFLLSSDKVENTVSWNTDCLAEDFWFANKACQLGFGGGFVPSVAREQSNWNIQDFLNQRRRWFCGMWKVGFFGQLMVVTWVLSTLELPLAVLTWVGLVSIPSWVAMWMNLYFSASSFTVLFATLIQDLDAAIPVSRIVLHLLLTPVLSLVVQFLQTVVVVYSIVRPAHGFYIVTKK